MELVWAIHRAATYYVFNVNVTCQNHMYMQQILLLK